MNLAQVKNMLNGSAMSLTTMWILAVLLLSSVDAYGRSLVLYCKMKRLVLQNGVEHFLSQDERVYVFSEENQTLRVDGLDCDRVVITSDKIEGKCGRGFSVIDRADLQLDVEVTDQVCIRQHYQGGGKSMCAEYENDTAHVYGQCRQR